MLIPTVLTLLIRIGFEIVGVSEASRYYLFYDSIFVPVSKSFLGILLFCVLHLIFSKNIFEKTKKTITFISNISFEIYITHQFIELAVYEYIPFYRTGNVWGAILMFLISVILIALNSFVLQYIVKLLQKGANKNKG